MCLDNPPYVAVPSLFMKGPQTVCRATGTQPSGLMARSSDGWLRQGVDEETESAKGIVCIDVTPPQEGWRGIPWLRH
jgi:hypothetical protein